MDDDRYDLFALLAKDSSVDERAVLLELLKEGSSKRTSPNSAVFFVKFSLAYLLALSISCIESLFLLTRRDTPITPGVNTLFATSSQKNTSNHHLVELIDDTGANLDVLVLESPLKRYQQQRIIDLPNLRIHWCRTPRTDLGAITHYFRCFRSLLRVTRLLSEHCSLGVKNLAMCLVRLIRGNSNSRVLKSMPIQKLVFTLSGNACTSVIEQSLKGVTQTIHWLHGVGLGFTFESFSDYTLVNNEYDYQFYNNGIGGEPLFFPDKNLSFQIPRKIQDIRTIVVYSNLIHPNNKNYSTYGIDVERDLLHIISSQFAAVQLILKPHPSSYKLLGNRIADYAEFVGNLGFRLWSGHDDLAPEETLYISTVSTSFIDLISCGRCVFMYEKFSSQQSGFQEKISPHLKFQDADTFEGALALFDDPGRLKIELEKFSVQSSKAVFEFLLNDCHIRKDDYHDAN